MPNYITHHHKTLLSVSLRLLQRRRFPNSLSNVPLPMLQSDQSVVVNIIQKVDTSFELFYR